MKKTFSKRLLSSVTALLIACSYMLPTSLTALADGEPSEESGHQLTPGETVKPVDDQRSWSVETDLATLLAGENGVTLGSDLAETISNYEKEYLLGVAADFCVYLENDFIVYDSDAEGRVAIGGNFVSGMEWGSYAIGFGDYVNHTRLEDLLDNSGFAYAIIGGQMEFIDRHEKYNQLPVLQDWAKGKAWLDDAYYDTETGNRIPNGGSDNNDNGWGGHDKAVSNKKVVIQRYEDVEPDASNSNVNKNSTAMNKYTAFVSENNGYETKTTTNATAASESGRIFWTNASWDSPKVDASQTYFAKLLNFNDRFTYLENRSQELADIKMDDKTEITFTTSDGSDDPTKATSITFKYTGKSTDKLDCVFFDLDDDLYTAFRYAKTINFENIPKLPDSYNDPDLVAQGKTGRPVTDNNGNMTTWEYAYIVVNVGAEATTDDHGSAGKHLHLVDFSNKDGSIRTNINNLPISNVNNEPGVSSLIYNFYKLNDGDKLVLGCNYQGSIFAPTADVIDEWLLTDDKNNNNTHGHLSGALIAKSFEGATEFGYRPFNARAFAVDEDEEEEDGQLEICKEWIGDNTGSTVLPDVTVTITGTADVAGAPAITETITLTSGNWSKKLTLAAEDILKNADLWSDGKLTDFNKDDSDYKLTLPKYYYVYDASGAVTAKYPYAYTAVETPVNGYVPSQMTFGTLSVYIPGDDPACSNVNNVYHVEISRTVDGGESEVVNADLELNSSSDWVRELENLPKFDANGKKYTYTAKLDSITGNTSAPEPQSIICDWTDSKIELYNTEIDNTSVSVEKIWVDSDSTHDAVKVEIKIMRKDANAPAGTEDTDVTSVYNGTYGITETEGKYYITLSDDNEWKWTLEGLPETDATGTAKYSYYVVAAETVPAGYEVDYKNNNTASVMLFNAKLGQLEVTKSWVDYNYKGFTNHPTITFTLTSKADATFKKEVTIKNGDDLTAIFKDLPIYTYSYDATDGLTKTPITYVLEESTVDHYKATITDDKWEFTLVDASNAYKAAKKVTVTNTYDATTFVEITKQWSVDSKWADEEKAIRPDSIEITISGKLADGTEVYTDTITVTGTNTTDTWTKKVDNLPEYYFDEKGVAQKITYTAKENGTDVYYEQSSSDLKVTNAYLQDEKTVTVTKSWSDNVSHDPITVDIVVTRDDGKEMFTGTRTLSDANKWTWSSADEKDLHLPKNHYTKDSETVTEYKYTVKVTEQEVPGYESRVDDTDSEHVVVYNTAVDSKTISLKGSKIWDDDDNYFGKRPDSIVVVLYANDVEYDRQTVSGEGNEWSYEFKNLPETDKDGKKITYTVDESEIPAGYTSKVNGTTITNTYGTDKGNTSVSGKKVWADSDNYFGKRPQSIEVVLYANGEKVDSKTISGSTNEWAYTFDNLPELDVYGKVIEYTVDESQIPTGYTKVVNGTTITNTYKTQKQDDTVIGKKIWNDDGKLTRPSTDEFRTDWLVIKQNGKVITVDAKDIDIKVSADGKTWEITVKNLPKYAPDESVYEYTFDEKLPENSSYKKSVNGTELVNDIKYVSASISKVNKDKNFVAGAVLAIYAADDAKRTDPIDRWTTDGAAHDITGKLIAGQSYVLVEEKAPDGYAYAKEITFTMSYDESEIAMISMTDVQTVVKVSKIDGDTKGALAGAKLMILDKDGNVVVDEWTTGADAKEIVGILVAGETYYIREVEAPEGYKLSEFDLSFTVPMDGTPYEIEFENFKIKIDDGDGDGDGDNDNGDGDGDVGGDDDDKDNDTDGDSEKKDNNNKTDNKKTDNKKTDKDSNVKTGDAVNGILPLAIIGLASVTLVIRKKDEE